LNNTQRGIIQDKTPSVLGRRHSQDVADRKAANGFVEDHQHRTHRMLGRQRIQAGHDALLGCEAAFAPGRRELGRIRIPGAKSLGVALHYFRHCLPFPLAVVKLDKSEVGNRLEAHGL
jgi:hypothetical protein